MTSPALTSVLTLHLLAAVVVHGAETASETVTSIFDSADGLDFSGYVLGICAILVGLLLAVAGYRFYHSTIYAIGFIGGGVIIALIVEHIFKDESWLLTASWIAFCVGGIICGYLVTYVYWVGIFVTGALAGGMLAILINTSFGYLLSPSHPGIVLIILVVIFALVGGALAVKLERPVLIIATSFAGAYLLVYGIGFLAGDYPTFNDLTHYRTYDSNGDAVYSIPSAWWAYLVGTLVIFALSVFLQFRKTGCDYDYHLDDRRAEARLQERQQRRQQTQQQQQEHYGDMGTPESNQAARYHGQPASHVV